MNIFIRRFLLGYPYGLVYACNKVTTEIALLMLKRDRIISNAPSLVSKYHGQIEECRKKLQKINDCIEILNNTVLPDKFIVDNLPYFKWQEPMMETLDLILNYEPIKKD